MKKNFKNITLKKVSKILIELGRYFFIISI